VSYPNRGTGWVPHTSGHAQDAWPRPDASLSAWQWRNRIHEGARNATYLASVGQNHVPSSTYLWQQRGVYPLTYPTVAYYGQMPISIQPIFIPKKPWERLR